MSKTSKLTIQQIAELAGVNKATVSRVLNGNANISGATRDKIMAIVEAHNYVPNTLARGLASNRTFTVGFCFDYTNKQAFANPYFQTVLQGVEEVVYSRNYLFLLMSVQEKDQEESSFAKVVREHRVDGLLIPSNLFTEAHHRLLTENGMPFVVIGEPANAGPGVRWVDIDNVQAASLLTDKLLVRGYADIRIVCDPAESLKDKFAIDRIRGYEEAMAGRGLPPRRTTVEQWASPGGAEALVFAKQEFLFEWLDRSDVAGETQAGSARPTLAAFDHSPFYRHLKYPMESIEIDLETMGTRAAELLLAVVDRPGDEPPTHIRVPAK